MFEDFRLSMSWLHTWSGLLVSWLLYFVFLTGTVGYFNSEIDRWMKPELPYGAEFTEYSAAIKSAQQLLNATAPAADSWSLELPDSRHPYLRAAWNGKVSGEAIFGPDGEQLEYRRTGSGQWLYSLHYRLHYLPIQTAYWLVSISAMIMLIALITGIVIHRKIFVDFFSLRPWKRARTWLDLHNLLSVPALPFHLMITYSGLLFLASTYWVDIFSARYEEKPAVTAFNQEFFGPSPQVASGLPATTIELNQLLAKVDEQWGEKSTRLITVFYPNDTASVTRFIRALAPEFSRTDRLYFYSHSGEPLAFEAPKGWGTLLRTSMVNLHEGLFAGTALRWLYFVSGLIGTGMIATGLVFWVEKRRYRKNVSMAQEKGFLLIERGNIGILLGVPLAIIGYFWLNRLVPVTIEYREHVEQNGFFTLIALSFGYSLFRGARTALRDLLLLIASMAGLLPFVSDFYGGSGLLDSLRKGDNSMLALNMCLLVMAAVPLCFLLRKRQKINATGRVLA